MPACRQREFVPPPTFGFLSAKFSPRIDAFSGNFLARSITLVAWKRECAPLPARFQGSFEPLEMLEAVAL
jgi:hypothetical protein